ncbi:MULTISPECIES: DNA polymerase III subunit delta [unclassified Bacillus (in: firmicutes)]|uniref:DNA polymerase III subunit delta n=1 Tax=unclassified Bacillus (in: firmicutes) TaxID=185979 RepID=UPI0008E2E24F|nr:MULTISPECIES: DNA polymerase III subunit delta [unclassified Bacillus (in: firmicutes)]SFA95415.1 DNA polymerase III, delta subunit [Bacillus sp. UNCCL13]SFQ79089.1 DNA polymerase III, delta subunit [Bacillus sp. cl95]
MVLDIWKQIKQKQIAPVYLLYGTEAFLINETKQLLLNQVLAEEEMDFNLSTYDLEETPIEVALEDAETFPFMGEKRVIFLHNPGFLTAEKTKDKVEHNIAKLEAYLKTPSPYAVVVFSAPYEKLDERKKITKELKKLAVMVEAKKLNENELKLWVRDRAAASGIEFEPEAIELMINLAGTNLFMLTNEVDKLALYSESEKKVSVQTVEKLVARSLEQNIFALIEKVLQRKMSDALRIYYDLQKQNEEPIKILSLLGGQFRLIYQVKDLSRRGYGQQQIASFLKVHPFRVKLAAGQAGKFSDEELSRIMAMLADADYQMKTGGMNKSLLVEMFLLKLNQ